MVINYFAKLRLTRKLRALKKAKIESWRKHHGLPSIKMWSTSLYEACIVIPKDIIIRNCCPCLAYKHGSVKYSELGVCGRIFFNDSYENKVIKNFFWFFIGCLISVLFLLHLIHQLNYSPFVALITTIVAAIFFTFGMAFSIGIRCIILLILPQMFSGRGRSLLLVYIINLVVTHPVQNTVTNTDKLVETLLCSQELLTNTTKVMIDTALSPLKAILNSIRKVVRIIQQFVKQLKKLFERLRDLFVGIAKAIGRVFSWLGNLVNVCNEKMGDPYRKCAKVFDDAIADCRRKLGIIGGLCYIVHAVSWVCHIVRIGELFCLIPSFVRDKITNALKEKIGKYVDDVEALFFVNITLSYHFNYSVEQSQELTNVRKNINREIREKTSFLNKFLSISNLFSTIMFIRVILKAVIYRKKYLSKNHFDNYFITRYIKDIEERRTDQDKETIFPLKKYQRSKYISALSFKLAKNERFKFFSAIFLFFTSSVYVGMCLLMDYGLYWLLTVIRKHGRYTSTLEVPEQPKLHVEGKGVLGNMYRWILSSFQSLQNFVPEIDTRPCLPLPSHPNYNTYTTIVIFQPYGLRLRHVIASCYYPQKERERAMWLYNHILKTRGGFLKYMRRKLREKSFEAVKPFHCLEVLAARSPILRKLLHKFGFQAKYCRVCGDVGHSDDYVNFKHCVNPGCNGVYCIDCFTDLNNLCTICMKPIDYDDISDISEERDSSDEEPWVTVEGSQISSIMSLPLKEKSVFDYRYQYGLDSTSHDDEGSDSEDSKKVLIRE